MGKLQMILIAIKIAEIAIDVWQTVTDEASPGGKSVSLSEIISAIADQVSKSHVGNINVVQ